MSVLERIRPDLAGFVPYASARRAGHRAGIRLDANEAPWLQAGDGSGLNRYPSPQPSDLLAALAGLYGVRAGQVYAGRGSDEAIDLLVRLFCRAGRDNVVTLAPTFGMYQVAASLQGVALRRLALDPEQDFALDPQRLLDLVDDDTRLVFLCSPNNPTGTDFHARVEPLARALAGRALLVVDEAYVEFAGHEGAAGLLDRHENLAILRTLSKLHALAGARVGALLAAEPLVARIAAIAAPYPLPAPSVAAALAALAPPALARTLALRDGLLAERERLRAALAALPGIDRVWPSAGNFLLMRCHDAAATFARALAGDVLLRDVSGQPGLAGCLRASIGTRADNGALLAALAVGVPA